MDIAKLAVKNGYNSLSERQKFILCSHLTKKCSGHAGPGGFHNECVQELSGESLLDAYRENDDIECLQCKSCSNKSGSKKYNYCQ